MKLSIDEISLKAGYFWNNPFQISREYYLETYSFETGCFMKPSVRIFNTNDNNAAIPVWL